MESIGVITPFFRLTKGQVVSLNVRQKPKPTFRRQIMVNAKEIAKKVKNIANSEDVMQAVSDYVEKADEAITEYVKQHPEVSYDYVAIALPISNVSLENKSTETDAVIGSLYGEEYKKQTDLTTTNYGIFTDSYGFLKEFTAELMRLGFKVRFDESEKKVVPWVFLKDFNFS